MVKVEMKTRDKRPRYSSQFAECLPNLLKCNTSLKFKSVFQNHNYIGSRVIGQEINLK
jgi:hypothetical protein